MFKLIKKHIDVFFLLISLLLILVTYHVWFLSFDILTFGDWGYYLPETQKEFLRFPFSWNSAGLGFVDIGLTIYPIAILAWGLLAQFFDYGIVSRITYFFPSVLFGVFGIYLLNRKVGISPFGAFVGMLIFNFNTYILLGRTGHLTLMTAFGIAPLVIYFFIRTLDEKKFYLSILTGLFGALASFYELRAFYIIFFILFSYFIFYIYINKYYISLKQTFTCLVYAFPPLIIYIFLNIFWVVGISQAGGIAESGVVGRSLFGEGYMSNLRAITLFHPFWSYSRELIFTAQSVPTYFWIIPLFAFLGMFLNRRKPIVIFFGAISLLGIFLTKQTGQPFPDVYKWLYEYFPGFNAFRESTKFYFVTALGFSILIGFFVDWTVKKKKLKKKYKSTFFFVLLILFLVNIRPFVTTEVGKLFTARYIQNDYKILNAKINSEREFYRTLWIPRDSRWGTWGNLHPKLSGIDLVQTTWKNLNQYNKQGKDFIAGEQITGVLYKSFSDNLMDRASIKYVIIPTEDLQNEDDFIKYYGKRSYFVERISQIPFLKKLDLGTDNLLVYENEDYYSLFSTSELPDDIEKQNDFKNIESKFINATLYEITINNLNKPVYLYFSQTYHPGWSMSIGKGSNKEWILADTNHTSSIDNLNIFYMDPQTIKKNLDKSLYTENPDGSISFTASVYFKPQDKVTTATYVSLVSLVLILMLFFVFYIKKR